jgi:hypothetical protein
MQTGNGRRGGLPTNIIPNPLSTFKTVSMQSFCNLKEGHNPKIAKGMGIMSKLKA